MIVQILWLSDTHVCYLSYLMVVQILWSSTSYGCPHLIVVHILWFDLMIVRFLWLYLMVSYGCQVTSYGCPCWWLSCWWLSSNPRMSTLTLLPHAPSACDSSSVLCPYTFHHNDWSHRQKGHLPLIYLWSCVPPVGQLPHFPRISLSVLSSPCSPWPSWHGCHL